MVEHGDTFYEVLGVESTADVETIEQAYREQVRRYHPDRPAGDHDRMRRINKAKEILTDPLERRRYHRLGHDEYIEHVRPAGWTEASDSETAESDTTSETATTDDSTADSADGAGGATRQTDHDPNDLGGQAEPNRRRRRGASAASKADRGHEDTGGRADYSRSRDDSVSETTGTGDSEPTGKSADRAEQSSTGDTETATDQSNTDPVDDSQEETTDSTADPTESAFEWASAEPVSEESDDSPSEADADTSDSAGDTATASVDQSPSTDAGAASTEAGSSSDDDHPDAAGDAPEAERSTSKATSEATTQQSTTGAAAGSRAAEKSRQTRHRTANRSSSRSTSTGRATETHTGSKHRGTTTDDESESTVDAPLADAALETGHLTETVATVWATTAAIGDRLAPGQRYRTVAALTTRKLADSERLPSQSNLEAAIRSSRTVEYLATARPGSYAVPRTLLAVVLFASLVSTVEVLTGTRPGLPALGLCAIASAGLATVRESSQLLFDESTADRRSDDDGPTESNWTEDRLLQTSIGGTVGVLLFLLGFALSGPAIVATAAAILLRIGIAMAFFGIGGAIAAKIVDRSPWRGGLTLGLLYVVPATLLVPPDRWLLGGGLPGKAGGLWFPVVSLGPLQIGQLFNVVCAVAMISSLVLPLLAFGVAFSTLLRRDVLDRGYAFEPLWWELGALCPALFGSTLVFAPGSTIGPLVLADAGQTVLLWSLAVWPTIFLCCYALERLDHDDSLPDPAEELAAGMSRLRDILRVPNNNP